MIHPALQAALPRATSGVSGEADDVGAVPPVIRSLMTLVASYPSIPGMLQSIKIKS